MFWLVRALLALVPGLALRYPIKKWAAASALAAASFYLVLSGAAVPTGGKRPDVLIEREGATAALRSGSGNLVFPPATVAGYSVDN